MTILAHEFGHVWDIATDVKDYTNKINNKVPFYDNAEEKRAVNGIEKDVATYYNEGIRQNHRGGSEIRTLSSTTTEEALPTVEQKQTGQEMNLNGN